ncbi:hypothetical protein [Melittangium boletus]|uniref:Immediate early protein ICP0 n=1 Tax=Melittangium boletus DSM 14713 TaxID=1294270 RepID=A0A250ICV1_9BACT|nr:hypothetical protein [Melittangium boletus]ATB29053.1 hypothetical protein MEBOL_002502 [Melittangium boletus DSM 14713]
MEREERTRIGRSPLETRPGAGPAVEREERTRIGRSPLESGAPGTAGRGEPESRPGGTRDAAKPGRWTFTQDGLETRNAARPTRTREIVKSAELFEKPAPRTTGERPRVQTSEGQASSNFENREREVPRTADRASPSGRTEGPDAPDALETQAPERAEVREDVPDVSFEDRAPERPRTPERAPSPGRTEGGDAPDALETQAPENAGRPEETRDAPDALETQAPEQSEPAERTEGQDAPDTVFDAPEGKEGTRPPRTQDPRGDARFEPPPAPRSPPPPGETGQPKRIEDLLPKFSEPIGQESLAHHFAEELAFLGAELRPSRMAPGERALRLWAFFAAYARANAKDPAGQSPAGRARFEQALTQNGFAALRDSATGTNGVETALAMLDAGSPEELQARLAGVRIEPGPEQLPSEVFLPVVEEHQAPPERPAAKAAPAPQPAPAKASLPELPVAKAVEPPVDPDEITQPQDAPEPTATAPFDQKEPEAAPAQQAVMAPGVPNPALVPPRGVVSPRDALKDLEVQASEHRGTNKRLGPHMLWNALHGLRDSPEDSAVLKEQWSQLAFGSIIALVGAALLVAMLASL